MLELKKEIRFVPAYDRSNDPKGNFGIHGVDIVFFLSGPKGGAEFKIMTNWYLPQNQSPAAKAVEPFGAGILYHAKAPQREDQSISDNECELTGGVCYCDGWYSQGDPLFKKLIAEGDDAVWNKLQEVYDEIEWVEIPREKEISG